MKHVVQSIFLLMASLSFAEDIELVHPNHPETRINLEAPDFIKDLGDGKLKIWVIEEGTRSEGLHGILQDVDDPSEQVTSMDTPEGKIVYRGDWDNRPFLWSASGWLPENLKEPFVKEERIEYLLSPLELAVAIEDTLNSIVEKENKQDQASDGKHTINYNYRMKEEAIVFTLIENRTTTAYTVTAYVVNYAEKRTKWEKPKNRSELTVRSFTKSEGTTIEELGLLDYRWKQIKEAIRRRSATK